MGNPEKGEVDVAIGGKTYVLGFTTNTIVQVETIFGGKDFNSILVEWQAAPTLGTFRALLWGALLQRYPETSLLDAGDLIDQVEPTRGMEELGAKLGEAIRFRLSGPKPARPAAKRRSR